jgi:hypothetical protein
LFWLARENVTDWELYEGRRCENGEYIKPGTKVKLPATGEYGIVAHCWYSNEIFDFDCYVAFFGTSFPERVDS